MQCPTCFNNYPDKIANCPRCRQPLAVAVTMEEAAPVREKLKVAAAPRHEARVLEFPDPAQSNRPQWRQEVSARLRAYQSRRGRIMDGLAEAEIENPEDMAEALPAPAPGVVSLSHRKELAPLVVRALQRLERARQTMPQPTVAVGPGPVMRMVTEPEITLAVATAPAPPESTSGLAHGLSLPVTITVTPAPEAMPVTGTETARVRRIAPAAESVPAPAEELPPPRSPERPVLKLAIVPTVVPVAPSQPATDAPPRLVCPTVVDDDYLERVEVAEKQALRGRKKRLAALEENEDDFAPWKLRLRAALIDWGIAAATSLPLLLWAVGSASNWRWKDLLLLFCLHSGLFMALYTTALTFYAGRTWGQELLFLCVADIEDGGPPTLRQCSVRAGAYLLWPLTLGLGLLYALVDQEGQALHDKVSGTIVLRS